MSCEDQRILALHCGLGFRETFAVMACYKLVVEGYVIGEIEVLLVR